MKNIKYKKINSKIFGLFFIFFFCFFITTAGAVTKNDWSYSVSVRGSSVSYDAPTYEECKKLRDDMVSKIGNSGVGICVSKSGQVAPGGTTIPKAEPKSTDYYFSTIIAGGISVDSTPTTIENCNKERLAKVKSIGDKGRVSECESKKVVQQRLANAKTEADKDKVLQDAPVEVSPGTNTDGSVVSKVYTLLAPIGTMKTFDTTNIGDYFNMIFKLAIGLCAALAVIMIIVGGVQYMGDESVFGKTNAKDRILSAILGLLIAIGSWVLLNTINPDLTGSGGVNISQVSAEIEEETVAWDKYEVGNSSACTGGYEDINTVGGSTPAKINVCKSIGPNLVKMLNAASQSGLKLSGAGSRSKATQLALRAKNCQPPTKTTKQLESGNIKCHTATAIPGTSNHEKGLAIDFNCNGIGMIRTDTNNKCYKWLVANAGAYGFKNNYNQIREVWHWSTTGN